MAALYFIALCGVSAALLFVLIEAAWSVTRRPVWAATPHATPVQPRLLLLATADRRTQSMPFVGADPRRNEAAARVAQRPARRS